MVAELLFERSSNSDDRSNNIQHGQPARGLSQSPSRGHAWHQPTHEVAAEEAENNDVMYKIRKWSLPDADVMPVLNVSSRVTWLELDDRALLDSYAVLQEGILCYQGGSRRDDYRKNLSERTAQIAGQAPVDGHQD